MRRTAGLLLVVMLLAGLVGLALAGCGGSGVKVGNAEVETKDGSTTVKTPEGDTTVKTTKAPTEAELGMPVYPDAMMDENTLLTSTSASGEKLVTAGQLWTTDSTDKVIAWYQGQLSGKPEYRAMPITEGGVNEMIFYWKDGDISKTVTVGAGKVDHKGQTVIVITAIPSSAVPPTNQ
jgi:hypothetical protein